MREAKGNIWNGIGKADAVVITTNGFVRKDGRATMGAGVALQALKRFPNIDLTLGKLIQENGSKVQIIMEAGDTFLVSFPVKPMIAEPSVMLERLKGKNIRLKGLLADKIPGWAAVAQPDLIMESCQALFELTCKMNWHKVILPRPGCGNGGLNYYNVVKPILEKHLTGKRFYIIHQPRRHNSGRTSPIRKHNS